MWTSKELILVVTDLGPRVQKSLDTDFLRHGELALNLVMSYRIKLLVVRKISLVRRNIGETAAV